MGRDWVGMISRGLRKPPRVIAQRLLDEVRGELERINAPRRPRRLARGGLLHALNAQDIHELWGRLSRRPYPAVVTKVDPTDYDVLCPGDGRRIIEAADAALAHRVDLLGSGPLELGQHIDWHRDHKSGHAWAPRYFRSIDYNNPDRPSDVKFPWELSRMQWLIPAGQAYLLTSDERYAIGVRDVIDDWIEANPYAHSVNWACTMEVAVRILTWTWFFHVFSHSIAWSGRGFRVRFLLNLFLHGDFTSRHLERSDINGNHYTANAAGLVFAGLFFGEGAAPVRWERLGWKILCDELPRQVYPDGVDFEGSIAYHRLVLELFLLPALFRKKLGRDISTDFVERVVAMARFTAAYCRPDGTVPLWGDADDARALPFGGQTINDHRYLIGLVSAALGVPDLEQQFSGSRSEVFWLLGVSPARKLAAANRPNAVGTSQEFPEGGFFVMRNQRDHVFIDCGPVGLAGRGGHGHNDCLSFELVLDGMHLIADCGAYLYTASYEERNRFRSTAWHNTPRIDEQEINRFIRHDWLWNLHYDAVPTVRKWGRTEDHDVFCGTHSGYQRLDPPIAPVRTIVLDYKRHILFVEDEFEGSGEHRYEIPLHLAPGVQARAVRPGLITLRAGDRVFELNWGDEGLWNLEIRQTRLSPSYGVILQASRLTWSRRGNPAASLTIKIAPIER
jgi:uncharacterized heparinase superfamily protein